MTIEEYRNRVVEQSRASIRDAAVRVFLSDGYERASMEHIAKEAGVSTATLYKHAKSKSALFGWLLAAAWGVDRAPVDWSQPQGTDRSPREIMTTIGRHYADSLSDEKIVALFRVIIAESDRFPELGNDLYELAKRPYLESIERYLSEATSAGQLRVPDPPSATRQFLGMINDQVFWPGLLVAGFRVEPAARRDVIDEAVTTFLARFS